MPNSLVLSRWLLLASVCLLLIGIGLWFWRVRPWRGARTRYPVVLVHGILGFVRLGVGPLYGSYFRGVAKRLEEAGVKVFEVKLSPLGSVSQRAAQLNDAIKQLGTPRVNVVAHSMGGLDTRLAVHLAGPARRIASLTSIGTPHRGTPVADLGGGLLARFLMPLAGRLGLPTEALLDLGVSRSPAFNACAPDHKKVRYFSVLAQADSVHPLLKKSHAWLLARQGANDGMVPLSSQRHGKVLARIRADHWAQIGWSGDFDAPALYLSLCRKLRARGL